jgi:hypothetical protein
MAKGKKKQTNTSGRALPFDRSTTEETYGPAGSRNSVTRQRGFDVAVRKPGKGYESRIQKPGYVTETFSGYESSKPSRTAPSLRRGSGNVYLKSGGVVGPKNVDFSTADVDNIVKSRLRDKAIKVTQRRKESMEKAGRNTSGRRRAQ